MHANRTAQNSLTTNERKLSPSSSVLSISSCFVAPAPAYQTNTSLVFSASGMVQTRSGHDVFYTEASYGRAARNESTRKRRKRKLTQASMREFSADNSITSTTPQRTPRKTRAQIRQEEELSTPPSTLNRVGRTPPIKTERLLRGKRKPTCSDYGIARHFSFQGNGFFFCHPCDVWDSLPPDQVTKSSRLSARLGCVANHESFSHPTTLCKVYCRQSVAAAATVSFPTNNKDSDSEDGSVSSSIMGDEHEGQHGVVAAYNCELELEEEEGHATTTTSTSLNVPECTTTQGHAVNATTHNIFNSNTDCNNGSDRSRQGGNGGNCSALVNNQPAQSATVLSPEEQNADLILELKGTIQMLQKWNLKLARDIKKLRDDVSADKMKATNNCTSQQNSTAYQDAVLEAIRGVTGRHNRRLNSNRTGVLVANALWNHTSFQPHLLKLARKYFRENVFTPYNILREMDLAGGTLSYEGIDVLRRVETCGVKRFRGSIIPSKSEIKRIASVVEWYACQFCPFTSNLTTKGESIEFDFAKSMLCITKAFYLDDIGKTRSLSIASSIDGASLSKNLSIIAGGVKITDLAARCPSTKRPLLDDPLTMSAQSRNLCIPLKIMMGRETKETFTEFGALFKFLDDLSDTTTMPKEMEDFKPFSCMTNCDLSAQWKGLCKGGATKVHTLPCTCCATESDELATPNNTTCVRWCNEHSSDPEWMCFHKPTATPERVESMQEEVRELLSMLEGALEEIQAESRMTRFDVEVIVPSQSSTCDPLSIHFCPTNTTQRQSYSQLTTNELILRGLDINGSLETRREMLRHALIGESTINRLSKEISHGEVREGAYFVLMQTLPCVLHMENRNGIKLMTMAFIEGLSNAKKKCLYNDTKAEGKRVSRFISDVESLMNRAILGSDDDPCQWMCPYDPKKKELGPITMDNVRTRRVIDSLDKVIDLCVIDEGRKTLWLTALNNYRIAMVLLRKRDDFTNPMIASYQHHADKFFQAWIQLWQKEGITNYIHMIGSGHISDYLYKWKNLYRFSQQGWEAMNSLIKTFFFRRTSHGGGVRGLSKKSRLIPIARWLQRRLIFLCRIDEDSICQYLIDNPMPQNYCTQAASEEDVYD